MEWGIWIFVGVLVLGIIGLLVLFPLDELDGTSGNSDVSSPDENFGSSDSGSGSSTGFETGSSGSGSSGSGGSGGGGSGGSGMEGSENCVYEEVSYSLLNLNKTDVCNEFSGGDCIDKSVTCTLEANNLDGSGGAEFNIEFIFYDSDVGIVSVLGTILASQFIDAGESYDFSVQATFASEDASKNIGCYFKTEEDPVKEICS